MRHRFFPFFAFCACALLARGNPASPALLEKAVENWLGERDHWAFTQRAVEYDKGETHERLERYDPSKPGDQRWQLLAIDGQTPTPTQRAKWADKKFKHRHRRFDSPLGDYFDFGSAKVVSETPQTIRFDVPLRHDKSWLFPVDKVDVRVTVNKQTHALEHLAARVREPFKVLLGIARITGGEADLDFLTFDDSDPSPAAAKPSGAARVSVSKLGERVDFTWSDFKRVTPAPDRDRQAAADALPELNALTREP